MLFEIFILYKSHMTVMFFISQVVQINKNPLTVSLIATKTANTGQLVNLEKDLSVVVKDLAQAVVET